MMVTRKRVFREIGADRSVISMNVGKIYRNFGDMIDWGKIKYNRRHLVTRLPYIVRWVSIGGKSPINMIDTEDKLAFYIRSKLGFGEYMIFFFDLYLKNKRYNPLFKCSSIIASNCEYRLSGICTKLENIAKHKPGMTCLKNKRTVMNYTKRAVIKISPTENITEDGIDFTYSFDPREMKMYMMWFWKGKQKDKKKELKMIEDNKMFTAPVKSELREDIKKNI